MGGTMEECIRYLLQDLYYNYAKMLEKCRKKCYTVKRIYTILYPLPSNILFSKKKGECPYGIY